MSLPNEFSVSYRTGQSSFLTFPRPVVSPNSAQSRFSLLNVTIFAVFGAMPHLFRQGDAAFFFHHLNVGFYAIYTIFIEGLL